ncbi:MAG: PAS domain S-box protein [Candidatus Thorarchaeota archaeon]|jgi:PAS domain S-box-containing protein
MATPDEKTEKKSKSDSSKLLLIWLAWIVVVAFTLLVYIQQIPIYYSNLVEEAEAFIGIIDISPTFYAIIVTFRDIMITVSFTIVAVSLLRGSLKNPQIIFVSLVLFLLGVGLPALLIAESGTILDLLSSFICIMAGALLIVYIFILPDGKFYPSFTRILAPILMIAIFVNSILLNFYPQFSWPQDSLFPLMILCLSTGILVQGYRYGRYYSQIQKQQTKWVILGFVILIIGAITLQITRTFATILFDPVEAMLLQKLVFMTVFGLLPALSIPITTSYSIRRYRLWDLGEVVGRGLQNLFFISILAGILMFVIGIILPVLLPGYDATVSVLIATATIILSLFFQPLKQRMESVFDKFLYRSSKDLRDALIDFNSRIRTVIDTEEVGNLLIDQIMAISEVSSSCVFSFDNSTLNLIAEKGTISDIEKTLKPEIEGKLKNLRSGEVVECTESKHCQLLIPLTAVHASGRDLVGAFVIGTRHPGKGFSSKDIELLLEIGIEAGSAIYVSRLRQYARDREEQYRLLIETSADGIVVIDPDGQIQIANQKIYDMTGYSEEDLIDSDMTQFVIEEEKQRAIANLKRVAANKDPIRDEFQLIRKDGSRFHAETSVSAVRDEASAVVAFLCVIRDLTKSKKHEFELEDATERAQLYLDLLGHDISNQLQAILGGAEIARMMAKDSEAAGSLLGIGEAAERCERIIRKIKETEELHQIPLVSMDLVLAVHTSVEGISLRFPNVVVKTDIIEGSAMVQGDRFINDMCLNLLENAYVHNTNKKKVIWVSLTSDRFGYVLTVSDNGPGIHDRTKEQLFDVKRRYGGVGLHQTREIVEKYKGRITVGDRTEGRPEEGAIFTIWLPKE